MCRPVSGTSASTRNSPTTTGTPGISPRRVPMPPHRPEQPHGHPLTSRPRGYRARPDLRRVGRLPRRRQPAQPPHGRSFRSYQPGDRSPRRHLRLSGPVVGIRGRGGRARPRLDPGPVGRGPPGDRQARPGVRQGQPPGAHQHPRRLHGWRLPGRPAGRIRVSRGDCRFPASGGAVHPWFPRRQRRVRRRRTGGRASGRPHRSPCRRWAARPPDFHATGAGRHDRDPGLHRRVQRRRPRPSSTGDAEQLRYILASAGLLGDAVSHSVPLTRPAR